MMPPSDIFASIIRKHNTVAERLTPSKEGQLSANRTRDFDIMSIAQHSDKVMMRLLLGNMDTCDRQWSWKHASSRHQNESSHTNEVNKTVDPTTLP